MLQSPRMVQVCHQFKNNLRTLVHRIPSSVFASKSIKSPYDRNYQLFRYCRRKMASNKVCSNSKYVSQHKYLLLSLASHLCDTIGCISEHHFVSKQNNSTNRDKFVSKLLSGYIKTVPGSIV
jgi:hypothetical protein